MLVKGYIPKLSLGVSNQLLPLMQVLRKKTAPLRPAPLVVPCSSIAISRAQQAANGVGPGLDLALCFLFFMQHVRSLALGRFQEVAACT